MSKVIILIYIPYSTHCPTRVRRISTLSFSISASCISALSFPWLPLVVHSSPLVNFSVHTVTGLQDDSAFIPPPKHVLYQSCGLGPLCPRPTFGQILQAGVTENASFQRSVANTLLNITSVSQQFNMVLELRPFLIDIQLLTWFSAYLYQSDTGTMRHATVP